MLLKTGQGYDLQIPLLEAAQAGKLDLADMTRRAESNPDIFTVPELLRFYLVEISRRVRRKRRKRRRR